MKNSVSNYDVNHGDLMDAKERIYYNNNKRYDCLTGLIHTRDFNSVMEMERLGEKLPWRLYNSISGRR